MLTADQSTLLTQLSGSWPAALAISVRNGLVEGLSSHPLREEIIAFSKGDPCCLPFFLQTPQEIAWINLARDSNALQATIENLRCWILPSFGWQDPCGWLVTSTRASTGDFGRLLVAMSPSGYCRWLSRRSDFDRIVEKLRRIRVLEQACPYHFTARVPSLLEARQQFVTALVAGDRGAAEAAIDVIDRNKIDTADNTLFMRVRCWERFGEIDRIVRGRETEHLTHLRIPHRIRLCVLRAFHETYLAKHEEDNDADGALEAYRLDVHDRLGGMIRVCQPSDGRFVFRMLVYRAIVQKDASAAISLSEASDDQFVRPLLAPFLRVVAPQMSLQERFFEARKRQDWREVQRLGVELLGQGPEYRSILEKSLEYCVNPQIESLLIAQSESTVGAAERKPLDVPQSWTEWFACLTDAGEHHFQPFLDNRQKPDLFRLIASDVTALHDVLERVYIDAPFEADSMVRQLLLSGLPEFMEDFVVEPGYPRDQLAPIYLDLFRLWSGLKSGSAYPPDGEVLLNLAEGVLHFCPDAESEIVNAFRQWWNSRPVKALLPFLLGVVDLLDYIGTKGQCENFWILGVDFLHHKQQGLTTGERSLWRQIGSRIGYDNQVLDEYLPVPETELEVDALKQAGLKKVAIVSMRDRQAREAAAIIVARTGANVLIVTDAVAGTSTESAKSSDVILFVWSATTHAAFRAFDAVSRRNIAYVQGTGASSIVLALERWVAEQPKSDT